VSRREAVRPPIPSHTRGSKAQEQNVKTINILLCGVAAALVLLISAIPHTRAAGNEVRTLNVTIREWDVPTKNANPHDPAVGPDDALCFTEQFVSKLGRLDPSPGSSPENTRKTNKSIPHGFAAAHDGR